jgi:hypothetical protein
MMPLHHMRQHVKQFLAIAGLTALEAVRQPIVMILVYASLVFTALLPVLVTHVLGDAQRMIRDSALALHLVTGLLLAVYTSCSTLASEIRRGTAASVLSKPVGKSTFLLAKYGGVAAVLILFSAAMAAATLLSVRTVSEQFAFDWLGSGLLLAAPVVAAAVAGLQNYFVRVPFTSRAFGFLLLALAAAFLVSAAAAGEGGRFGGRLDWRIVPASVLETLAIVVLAALAVSLAPRMDVAPTLAVCGAVFLAGLLSDYFVGRIGPGRPWLSLALDLVPNWQHFWAVDALNRDGIPWSYVAHAARYAGLCLAGILAAGILAFRQMEVR